MNRRIGRYALIGTLGEGGMGVVHLGYDERLDRRVAIKTIHPGNADPTAGDRLLREARAAAGLSHPNVCQVYDAGEDEDGGFWVAMELLEGEPLSVRLTRGALSPKEAIETIGYTLGGLEALHSRGLIHRDVKPSNIFLTPHGTKLLDFGLVRPATVEAALGDVTLTRAGVVLGTPRYMAPEQWLGAEVGVGADLFAAGAVFFEMLAGGPAFAGDSIFEVRDAILNRHPPALSGGAAVLAADRVIQRALEKRPEDRHPTAREMAEEIRAILPLLDDTTVVRGARRTTRLVALPFRVLRPDPETDFLAFSLPDAVAGSLSGLDSVVVRSTLSASRFAGERPDLRALAEEAEVDLALTGTFLRAGDRIRVMVQLIEAAAGTVVWSATEEATLGDVFHLQDMLVQRIIDSLSVTLTQGERSKLARGAPSNPKAYEIYLRANQMNISWVYGSPLHQTAGLYKECLQEDPLYAPAWARLGRIYRLIAKYGHGDPDEHYRLSAEALSRALELDPDLSIAHNYATYAELDAGKAIEAMSRLIARGQTRVTEPDLFAGLVVACRFCGLLGASLAADRRAKRLDPHIRTSVHYTHFAAGDFKATIATDVDEPAMCRAMAHGMLGDETSTLALFQEMDRRGFEGVEQAMIDASIAAYEGRRDEVVKVMRKFEDFGFRDPEGYHLMSRFLSRLGETASALDWLARAVDGGFWCVPYFDRDPWLDPLRGEPEFRRILGRAREKHLAAADAYLRAGGPRLLGAGVDR